MSKRQLPYYLLLAVLLIGYVLVQYLEPEPEEDWTESYESDDDIPHGASLLYTLLPDLFPGQEIKPVRQRVYTALADSFYQDHAYMLINNDLSALDRLDVEYLLDFVYYGNDAFLATRRLPLLLSDSLGVEVKLIAALSDDSTEARFLNPGIPNGGGFDFMAPNMRSYFELSADTTFRWTTLAINNQGKPNVLRVEVGEGSLILCSLPLTLTNVQLLDSTNRRFATLMLSHLPAQSDVLWDEFYKVKHLERLAQSRNPLRYIISQPPLRYALWLTLLGVLILLLFQTKRKQRIIPLIPPLPNSTLEFTETVGRLYFQHGDHRNLAQKKIRYWLEHLRSQYHLNTEQFTPDFIASLAARSGISGEMAASLCREIDRLRGQTRISAEELSDLSSKLETFYEQSQGQATPASSNRIT